MKVSPILQISCQRDLNGGNFCKVNPILFYFSKNKYFFSSLGINMPRNFHFGLSSLLLNRHFDGKFQIKHKTTSVFWKKLSKQEVWISGWTQLLPPILKFVSRREGEVILRLVFILLGTLKIYSVFPWR